MFHSLTIHKALPNLTEDRLRVSLDNRYQAMTDPVAEHMLEPHLAVLGTVTWEDVYENWETDDLKYYWRDSGVEVVPRDMTYFDKGFEEALVLAREGDERARIHLQRIIDRDPETPNGKRAIEALG